MRATSPSEKERPVSQPGELTNKHLSCQAFFFLQIHNFIITKVLLILFNS